MRSEDALAIKGLRFAYGGRIVLDGVDLRVAAGEMTALFGPNGSGKSTLFRCVLGAIRPLAGSIRIFGRESASMDVRERARLVAYVPQDFRTAFGCTVRDLVAMGRTPHMGGRQRLSREDHNRVDAALEVTGLTTLADRPCTALSGGQKQLAAIARAVAQDARLVLLDEPTSALDFRNAGLVWDLVGRLGGKGISVLLCVHDPSHILWYCPRVAVLHHGRIWADGASRTVLSRDILSSLYGQGLACCEACGSVRHCTDE